ncbi:hypothetical protein GCWU000341_00201 [Oribacterium sp. oral taxon 078 str. F0262]|nr:hypothetical protein GCWU000341_00201 [Oribacterium sp. oral taxon 078 str. F0262]
MPKGDLYQTLNFNPRSPRGERLCPPKCSCKDLINFNPRSPRGERRQKNQHSDKIYCISIHAPLAGSDRVLRPRALSNIHFNPRSPRGERRMP